MALTAENVLQMAVGNLGQTETLSSIAAPTTKAETLGALFYATVRDRLLARHNWSWATRRAALVDVTTTEERDGWGFAYELPSDLVRVVDIDLGYRSGPQPAGLDPAHPNLPGARWTIEMNAAADGRVLLCDIEAATLVYVARVDDLDLWDADALEALTWALSARLAMPLTGKVEMAQLAEGMARKTLDEAIADDANESRPDPVAASEIISVRSW